jgi:hypothetical protein
MLGFLGDPEVLVGSGDSRRPDRRSILDQLNAFHLLIAVFCSSCCTLNHAAFTKASECYKPHVQLSIYSVPKIPTPSPLHK